MDAAVKNGYYLPCSLKAGNEVIVTSIAPIRMNGDTLEINPAAFKMANDAVAEDLLNKVPRRGGLGRWLHYHEWKNKCQSAGGW